MTETLAPGDSALPSASWSGLGELRTEGARRPLGSGAIPRPRFAYRILPREQGLAIDDPYW